VLILCLGVGTVTAQKQANGPDSPNLDVIKVDSNLVSVPVIVSDRLGRYLPDLKANNFKLYDNDAEQKIAYFDAAEEPLNVALLLDTSRSTEGVLDDIKKAANNFLKALRPQDRAMIVSFDFAVHHLSTLTSDRKVLEKAIQKAEVGRYLGTLLDDAVMEIASRDFKSITGRKAIILLTDGQDHGSLVSDDSLFDYESESDTMVYSIFYASAGFGGRGNGRFRFPGGRGRGGIFGGRGPIFDQFPRGQTQRGRRNGRNEEGAEFLSKLSEITSGRFYRSEATDLNQTFASIAEELRNQYRLGFYPEDIKKDGSLHLLRVKVDRADVAVRARRQYRTSEP
jgi:VWFA-related protein